MFYLTFAKIGFNDNKMHFNVNYLRLITTCDFVML